jgi:hypothetical protein
MRRLRFAAAPEGGGLLRVLFLRFRALSTYAERGGALPTVEMTAGPGTI